MTTDDKREFAQPTKNETEPTRTGAPGVRLALDPHRVITGRTTWGKSNNAQPSSRA